MRSSRLPVLLLATSIHSGLSNVSLASQPCASLQDTGSEFLETSFIEGFELSSEQTANLAKLAKVWGFLKYHHPLITAGEVQWDFELFRVLPSILDAADATAANSALLSWLESIGAPEACQPCAQDVSDPYYLAELDWIREVDALGTDLSAFLVGVYENRHPAGKQRYVDLVPRVSNADFSGETAYSDLERLDGGYRLLALFRFWNIVQWWSPYRDLLDEDWDEVLVDVLPRMFLADDPGQFQLEMTALIGRVNDTHSNLWGPNDVRPPQGNCQLPVLVRFVEGKVMVAHRLSEDEHLRVGDVITSLDGRGVDSLIEEWSPYYPASNVPTRLREIARVLTRGPCGEVVVEGERAGEAFTLTLQRVSPKNLNRNVSRWHDQPGGTFRLLSDDIAYLKLSSATQKEATGYIEKAVRTRGLVIDIRNYPNDFMVFALGRHLVRERTPFACFTVPDLANPGAFRWDAPASLSPAEPFYEGKVAILVDELSQSNAEYTAMAFRVAPEAVVIGSTTAGADGNVSRIMLPGGLRTMITGIGVFYPDRSPTQRVGILPDVELRPTIAGLAAGRDELLEEAVRQILGPEVGEEEVRRLASPPRR